MFSNYLFLSYSSNSPIKFSDLIKTSVTNQEILPRKDVCFLKGTQNCNNNIHI